MEINCIYCDTTGGYRVIHKHLVEDHLDKVTTVMDDENKMKYTIDCPNCDEVIEKQVKPRSHNKEFLDEFKAEIAIVAFDRLIFHVVEEHPEALGIDPAIFDDLDEE